MKLDVRWEYSYDRLIEPSLTLPIKVLAGSKLELQALTLFDEDTELNIILEPNLSLSRKLYESGLFKTGPLGNIVKLGSFDLPRSYISRFDLGKIEIFIKGKRFRSRIPYVQLLPEERFYEHIISLILTKLGSECTWLSETNPTAPDLRVIPHTKPKEVLQVECTTQQYDHIKLRQDYEKFKREKNMWRPKFTRLLIVSLNPPLPDVLSVIDGLDPQISFITFPNLIQLYRLFRRNKLTMDETWDLLCRGGVVHIAHTSSAIDLPREIRISCVIRGYTKL